MLPALRILAARLDHTVNDHIHQSRVAFLGVLEPQIRHHQSRRPSSTTALVCPMMHDHHALKSEVANIVKHITEVGEPMSAQQIHLNLKQYQELQACACSRQLSLKSFPISIFIGVLSRWPTVNPRNIRDKIYIVLRDHGQPMHFSKIAEHIGNSAFERNKVTVQAIHNELIKDQPFRPDRARNLCLETVGLQEGDGRRCYL